MNIVQGSVESLAVTVNDISQNIFNLSGLGLVYDVVPVDPATDVDSIPPLYTNQSCLSSGMMAQPLIDTSTGGTDGGTAAFKLAPNVASYPLTITAAVNDQFRYNSNTYIIAPGTYNTADDLAAAVGAALFGISPLSAEVSVTVSASKLLLTSVTKSAIDNGKVLNTGATHDALVAIGFVNGNTLASGVTGTAWARGKYRLYIIFTVGDGNIPKLGPIEFYVV